MREPYTLPYTLRERVNIWLSLQKHWVAKRPDAVAHWIARRLPKRIWFWAIVDGCGYATTGKYRKRTPNEVNLLELVGVCSEKANMK